MTVKELIEQLEKQPPDALIFTNGLEVRTPLTNNGLILIVSPRETN